MPGTTASGAMRWKRGRPSCVGIAVVGGGCGWWGERETHETHPRPINRSLLTPPTQSINQPNIYTCSNSAFPPLPPPLPVAAADMVVTVCAGACPPPTPLRTPSPPRAAAVATAVRERERRWCCPCPPPRPPANQAGATRPAVPMKSGRRDPARAEAGAAAAETRRLRRPLLPLLLPERIMVQAARDARRRRRVWWGAPGRRMRMQQGGTVPSGLVGVRKGPMRGSRWYARSAVCGGTGRAEKEQKHTRRAAAVVG